MTETKKVLSSEAKPQRKFNKGPKGKKPFKKGAKKVIPKIKRGDPGFLYTSVCCGAKAEKAPCERSPEDRGEGKFSSSPLGKWKCSTCRKKCKVNRAKNKPVEATVPAEPGVMSEQEAT